MKINKAISLLSEDTSIIVAGKTFEPSRIEELKLETGEIVYWVYDGETMWLSLDEVSEEIILFIDIEEDMDASEETVMYGGHDYEFTFESSADILEEGEPIEKLTMKDFEKSDGDLLRVIEFGIGDEVQSSIGKKVTEEELQEV